MSSRNCYVLSNTRMSVTLATRHRTKCISFFHDEYIKWIKHQMFSASSGVKFVYFPANSSSGKYENWWWTHSFRKRSRGQQLNSHQNLAVFVKFVVLFIWYIHLLHQSVVVPRFEYMVTSSYLHSGWYFKIIRRMWRWNKILFFIRNIIWQRESWCVFYVHRWRIFGESYFSLECEFYSSLISTRRRFQKIQPFKWGVVDQAKIDILCFFPVQRIFQYSTSYCFHWRAINSLSR